MIMNEVLPSKKCPLMMKSKFNQTMDNSMTGHTQDTKIRNVVIARIRILVMNLQSVFGKATTTFLRKCLECQFSVKVFAMSSYAFVATKSRSIFFGSISLILKRFFTVIAYCAQAISRAAISVKISLNTKLTFFRAESRLILPVKMSCVGFATKHANFFNSRFLHTAISMPTRKAAEFFLSRLKNISAFETWAHKNSLLSCNYA